MSYGKSLILSALLAGIVTSSASAGVELRVAKVVVQTGESEVTHDIGVVPNPDDDGKTYLLGGESGFLIEMPEYKIQGGGLFDPDPEIIYGFTVFDFGLPSNFGFSFSQPIIPVPAPGVAEHTYSGNGNASGNPGLTVTALAPPLGVPVDSDGIPEMSVYTLSTNGGTTLLSADLDLGPSLVAGAGASVHGGFNEGPIPGPAGSGSYDYMQVDVNFGLGGGGRIYGFGGHAVIIPEPTAAVIAGMGLLGLSAFRRRRA